MGTWFHSLVGKVKSSSPARKPVKSIRIKRGHVKNKNKAHEIKRKTKKDQVEKHVRRNHGVQTEVGSFQTPLALLKRASP